MHTLLEALAALMIGAVGILGGGTALVMRRLHRANRLVLERSTAAPASWLWSWRRSAMLHRRLRASCQLAIHASAPVAGAPKGRRRNGRRGAATSPLSRVALDLVDRASAVDARLVAADRLTGGWRRAALAAIESEVRQLEGSARRLSTLSAAWRDQLDSLTLGPPDLQDQLDVVEAALGELTAGTQSPPTAGTRSRPGPPS